MLVCCRGLQCEQLESFKLGFVEEEEAASGARFGSRSGAVVVAVIVIVIAIIMHPATFSRSDANKWLSLLGRALCSCAQPRHKTGATPASQPTSRPASQPARQTDGRRRRCIR